MIQGKSGAFCVQHHTQSDQWQNDKICECSCCYMVVKISHLAYQCAIHSLQNHTTHTAYLANNYNL